MLLSARRWKLGPQIRVCNSWFGNFLFLCFPSTQDVTSIRTLKCWIRAPPITVVGKIWSRWSLLGTCPPPTPPPPLFLNYSEFSIKVKEKDNGNKLPDQVSTFFLNIIHSLLELLFQYLRYLEHLLNIFSTFNLRPVPMGYLSYSKTEKNNKIIWQY